MSHFVILTSFLLAVSSQTVPELNVSQYLGRWYQVYSDFAVDATFENSSYCDTADYGLWPNGTIMVWNRERQYSTTGPERQILGWAAMDSPTQPGQLTVSLEGTGFPAPYWVYELGPATYNGSLYEYSVVSDPFQFTLFILARNITRFMNEYSDGVLDRLRMSGFTQFYNTPIMTPQSGCEYW
jgi:apolipoprotein D and lipocalin family protein